MKLPRRRFLQVVGVAAAGAFLSRHALALDYPIKPIRWIVGYPAGGSSATVNPSFFESLPFNVLRDIAPVSGIYDSPLVLVVNKSIRSKTTAEFIAHAKANPGKISMASFGAGTTSHLAGELFQAMTGTKLVHVPYRGEAFALSDMISGQVEVMFDT